MVDDTGVDREMSLIEDFWYIDPDGKKWLAPKASIIDGASIPRSLWTSVGSPYIDDYRRASIVHDVACNDPTVSRKDADVMFYFACLAGGCGYAQAKLLYWGVRIGSWASNRLLAELSTKERASYPVPFETTSDEKFVQIKFKEVSAELLRLPDNASIAKLDAVIEKHVKF